jgi:Sortase domain
VTALRQGRQRVLGPLLLWGLAAGLAAVAMVAILLGLQSSGVGPATASLVGRTATAPIAHEVGLVRSRPVHLSIPALGLSVSLSSLGLNADGTVSVPTDFNVPGWYRFGATPGQLGTAVILGHVDSYRGPAVFFGLRNLVVGDRVAVKLADGATARFAVIGIATYLKANFPAQLVYGPRPYGALQLVTCGGVFDRATGSYLSNVVVYTALVSAH